MTAVQEIVILNKLCRMCMKTDNVNVDLFTNVEEKIKGGDFKCYRDFLQKFAQTQVQNYIFIFLNIYYGCGYKRISISRIFQIDEDDKLPQKICESCEKHLQFVHNIKKLCIETDFSLRQTLKTSSVLKGFENLSETIKTSTDTNFKIEATGSEFTFVDPDDESENIDYNSIDCETKLNTAVVNTADKSNKLNNYKCNDCKKEFNEQNEFRQHMRLSHNEFKCYVCNKYFSQYQTLARHTKIHQINSKTKLCQYCHKTFSRSDDLKRHIRTHTNERPYKYILA